MFERFKRIHMIGIGGSGMSGIAEVLHNMGYEVTGSDLKESETVTRLKQLGIKVHIGHREENIQDAQVVVISSAVREDNPEVVTARMRGIPVIPRAEMLAEIGRLKYSILVAGAHGKTTTTSLIAQILQAAGYDPTVVVGGRLKATGSGAKMGTGEFFVAEADESDGSFLKLSPTIAVATNIDREHMNYFRTMDNLLRAFREFLDKVPFYGVSVLCYEDLYLRQIMRDLTRRYITYGFSEEAFVRAYDIEHKEMSLTFNVAVGTKDYGRFVLPMIGRHNVLNALAAITVGDVLGVEPNAIREALEGFSGVQRRFEFKGQRDGFKVYDDYGHHPTEIKAVLRAMKEAISEGHTQGRVVVIFQPHRWTRTYDLFGDFCSAFDDADILFLLDIYPAGEEPIMGVSAENLATAIAGRGKEVYYIPDRTQGLSPQDVASYVMKHLKEADVVLTLGAGDVYKVAEAMVEPV
ncbi:MAG: UDP-N-acetylmuramate--L-alanine ligase [Nitrospirae bacterium]|nr:MAG: UDP-N-acetylmuramate--L-alanine ligase [Nitrospirota bacterium]